MNIFYRIYCRTYQKSLKLVSHIIKLPTPEVIKGIDCLKLVPSLINNNNLDKVMIISDKNIISLPFMKNFLDDLDYFKISYVIFDKTVSNPTIDNVEEAVNLYNDTNCKGVIAIGGGSPIDCAKALGARIANPKKSINKMKGLLKVRKKLPPLFAIPTTAGTGSEATIASVITDTHTREKYIISDLVLIPKYAILDPILTLDLPKHITSTTGMDALTHAVESYIGKSNTKETKELSKKSIKLIYENLYKAYSNGSDLVARENMQLASYYAGVSFTKAYVGYVHAIAHTLGGYYSIPHGLANAIILPYILESFGSAVYTPLSELSDYLGLSSSYDSIDEKANKFIASIKELSSNMNIPNKIEEIKHEDIHLLAKRALKESHPLYPVPKLLTLKEIEKIYRNIKE